MNSLLKSLSLVIIAMAAIAITGCEQDWEKEFSTSNLKQSITATVEVNSIADSTAIVKYSLSDKGRIFIVVLVGDDNTEAPNPSTMLNLSTPGAIFKKQFVLGEEPYSDSVEVSGLVQNTTYKVFALPVNTDGVLGTVSTTDAFTTSDNHEPELDLTSGVSPAISNIPKQDLGFGVKLTFNEPVVLLETFSIKFGYRNAVTGVIQWIDVPKDSITINGNVVTIAQPLNAADQFNGMYIFLTIDENSFEDRAGNKFIGVESGIIGSQLQGIFWRNKFAPTKVKKILPSEDVITDTGMKIKFAFPMIMRFPYGSESPQYDQSQVIVRYKSSGTTIEKAVPQENVAISNDTIEITLPRTPVYGETVSIKVAEGMFRDKYGNPSAAIGYDEKEWLISYNYQVDLITASYSVELTDYNNTTTTVSASIEVATKGTEVLIKDLVKNYFSLTDDAPISGTFDGDFGTLSVPDMQPLFKVTVSGKLGTVYFANVNSADPIVGQIGSDGNFTLDEWGFYFISDDETLEGWVGAFKTSSWTKGVKSFNTQAHSITLEKIGKRF